MVNGSQDEEKENGQIVITVHRYFYIFYKRVENYVQCSYTPHPLDTSDGGTTDPTLARAAMSVQHRVQELPQPVGERKKLECNRPSIGTTR